MSGTSARFFRLATAQKGTPAAAVRNTLSGEFAAGSQGRALERYWIDLARNQSLEANTAARLHRDKRTSRAAAN